MNNVILHLVFCRKMQELLESFFLKKIVEQHHIMWIFIKK